MRDDLFERLNGGFRIGLRLGVHRDFKRGLRRLLSRRLCRRNRLLRILLRGGDVLRVIVSDGHIAELLCIQGRYRLELLSVLNDRRIVVVRGLQDETVMKQVLLVFRRYGR